ncbi:NAD-dependent epimerase/dehydratase family protein [Glaciimonas soli]|uniref:NAD-dependent epimerase/dehydratase family protein n=1 Tax=Glaciimonas soli TaxID=2590999 RepID=A0A843YNT4_9BURK|nr:NAD-dependent epimerase/dehydratase family protein [Glaciimonas soli]MQR00640.1 NAD-dependent epimerase/dehydratase family protein [Glaciimonas soli]
MENEGRALVLGATGGIGSEVSRQLRDAGWEVRALKRGLSKDVERKDGITWLRGDALIRQDVMNAAKNCSVIVHAVNPPGYRQWSELVLPMLENTIDAAIAESATIVLPGTVYNFGPDAFPRLTEESPQYPVTRKGAIRVQMEQRLREASTSGARVLIVRAGDFFGPNTGNGWFSQCLIKPGKPVNTISYPGQPDIGHQWAYLPDVARTMVALLQNRSTLDAFAAFHMAGHWDDDGKKMTSAISRVVTRHTAKHPKTSAFPWWLTILASPFVTTLREMQEMRYLWRTRVQMDNTKLIRVLGFEPHTPWDEAVEAALIGAGCINKIKATFAAA